MPAYSKPQIDSSSTSLNPMVFHARFLHIAEDIIKKMDIKTLKNCRQVSKSLQEFINIQNILWKNKTGTKAFRLACIDGH